MIVALGALLALAHPRQGAPAQNQLKAIHVFVSRNIAPSSKVQVTVNTRNIPVVKLDISPIDGEKWFIGNKDPYQRPKPVGPVVAHYDLRVSQKGQVLNRDNNFFSRQANIPRLHPGVYLVNVSAGGFYAWDVVDVTNMAIVVQRSPSKLLCWVTRFDGKGPVGQAKVDLFGPKNALLKRTLTDGQGIAFFSAKPQEGMLIIKKGSDLAAIQTNAENPDGQLRTLFQTDRPIYRPGQTIFFKAILRSTHGRGYDDLKHADVQIELRDPRDNPLDRQTITSNDIGTVSGKFLIPQEGLPGAYSLVLKYRDQSAYQTLTVAAYHKPEFKVTATPSKTYFLTGEDIVYNLDTEYYFGAPVPGARVDWISRATEKPMTFTNADDGWFYGGDGNLYPRDTYTIVPFQGQGSVITDAAGHAQVVIHTKRKAMDSQFSLDATVTDSSNRQVHATSVAELYSSRIRIGIENLRDVVDLGGLVPIRLHVQTVEGRPTAALVKVDVLGDVYNRKKKVFEKQVLATKEVQVPKSGQILVNMPALAEGQQYFVASGKDSGGRKAYASSTVWIAGIRDKQDVEETGPSLQAILDRKTYAPGDVVKCYVKTSTKNKPILVVFQGQDIWGYKVVKPSHGSAKADFRAELKESPNATMEACQWTSEGLLSSNAIVPIPDKTRLLNVQVIPEKSTYEPGDKASFTIKTDSSSGKGATSEVAFSLVDEAIYALSPDTTPDPYGFYWGQREDAVARFDSAPQTLAGGAFQQAKPTTAIRTRFEDTGYWNPIVETDALGVAHVSFELPGNLTQWRATARAITGDTKVGVKTADILATRPLTLRLATPQLLTIGDQISLTATLNNRTNQRIQVETSITADGVKIVGDSSHTVWLDPHGQQTVQYAIDADSMPKSGACKITGFASAIPKEQFADVSDAVQVSVVVIPRGVVCSGTEGGLLQNDLAGIVELPADALSAGSAVHIKVYAGLQSEARSLANQLIKGGHFGTYWAIDELESAAAIHLDAGDESIKDAFALLSRDQNSDGWGWWNGAPTESGITASVAMALAKAKAAGYAVYDNEITFAKSACEHNYASSNLWEEKARLAAACLALGDSRGDEFASEVIAHGEKISPYSWLVLADQLQASSPVAGAKILDKMTPLVSDGPAQAYVPVGFGIGWDATDIQTTAQLLTDLHRYKSSLALQSRLAMWLATSSRNDDPSSNDVAAMAEAMAEFGKDHPDAKTVGDVTVQIGNRSVDLKPSTVDESASADLYDFVLKAGDNGLRLTRSGSGTAYYTLDWTYYRPQMTESASGLRVVRRYEVRNPAGVWQELNRPLVANEPVRCTVMIWGDSNPDAIMVSEPLPAGFEFVDSDDTSGAYEAVLDGRIIHYLTDSGAPVYFRYYLRAQQVGRLVALPATAEFVRRPSVHGQSSGQEVTVTQ